MNIADNIKTQVKVIKMLKHLIFPSPIHFPVQGQ